VITKNSHPNIDLRCIHQLADSCWKGRIRTLDKFCLFEASEVCVGGTNVLGFGKKGVSLVEEAFVDVDVCSALSVKVIPVLSTSIVNRELEDRMKGRLGQRHKTSRKQVRPFAGPHCSSTNLYVTRLQSPQFFFYPFRVEKYFWVWKAFCNMRPSLAVLGGGRSAWKGKSSGNGGGIMY
jgi:hypothetical protein